MHARTYCRNPVPLYNMAIVLFNLAIHMFLHDIREAVVLLRLNCNVNAYLSTMCKIALDTYRRLIIKSP
jgi:hypothetical protein